MKKVVATKYKIEINRIDTLEWITTKQFTLSKKPSGFKDTSYGKDPIYEETYENKDFEMNEDSKTQILSIEVEDINLASIMTVLVGSK